MKKIIAILLITIGLILVGMPVLKDFLIQKDIDTISESITEISPNKLEQNKKTNNNSVNYDGSKINSIDMYGEITNQKDADMSKIIGQVVVPDIDMNIAIFKGLDNNNLLYGAATMKPNMQMGVGNYAIAGHFYKNKGVLFGGLMDIKKGNIIKITNKKYIYEYEVFDTKIASDESFNLISDSMTDKSNSDAIVTLMTCYYNENNKRYFVFGELENITKYTPEKMLKGLN